MPMASRRRGLRPTPLYRSRGPEPRRFPARMDRGGNDLRHFLGSAINPLRLDRLGRTCAPGELVSSDVPWGVARRSVSASTGPMYDEARRRSFRKEDDAMVE
jgi:hypothetical protein